MAKLIHKLLPRYGNWGGPGWSGGKWQENYENTDWEVPARDSLDVLFKIHDRSYQQAIANFPEDKREPEFDKADKVLSNSADELSKNPSEWPEPPKTASWLYAWLYRKLVIVIFHLVMRLYI